ncbi:unnamed protein product [Clavelina lepadiformis]|uniref:Innexin n=1 Tax=Clavelina lepadiformis TaxID=159417 RepID=A0ABP0GR31_CLALP
MSSSTEAAFEKLDSISKEHEAEVVIDLGADRLLKWIGVYLLLALAVVIKITDYVGPNLSCYPVNQSKGFDNEFITFANAYCWEPLHEIEAINVCDNLTKYHEVPLVDNPNNIKQIIVWIPYFILVQAFLYAIPSVFWHLRMGARLMGHLKFMKLLMEYLSQELQKIYRHPGPEEGYDEDGLVLTGLKKYPIKLPDLTNVVQVQTVSSTAQHQISPSTNQSGKNTSTSSNATTEQTNLVSKHYGSSSREKSDKLSKFIVGQMKDRQLFSMFCFENFSSFYQLPYILSVFKLWEFNCTNKKKERDYRPPLESLLDQWCHEKNFNCTLLVKMYFLKHICTGLVSLIMLIMIICGYVFIIADVESPDSFSCQLPYHDLCVLCNIKRKKDVVAVIWFDFAITLLVCLMSFIYWWNVRNSREEAKCNFFEQLHQASEAALRTARLSEEIAKEQQK